MKIVKITGGLGNQMFQYAFAVALKEKGQETFIDTSSYIKKTIREGIDFCHNGFELSTVFANIKNEYIPFADSHEVSRLSTPSDSVINRIRRKFFTKKTHYIDKSFQFDSSFFTDNNDLFLEGYWQSESYFRDFTDKIHFLYSFPDIKDEMNIQALQKVGTNSVSIHVRRGDYLNSENLNVCTEKYYNNAINEIVDLYKCSSPITGFLVFSDDISWCKTHLKFPTDNIIFVDWNTNKDSWKDMHLMSLCNNNIIANSSFSWWGAWLNNNPNKVVLAPEIWNMRELNNKDIYYSFKFNEVVPSSWKRVSI